MLPSKLDAVKTVWGLVRIMERSRTGEMWVVVRGWAELLPVF